MSPALALTFIEGKRPCLRCIASLFPLPVCCVVISILRKSIFGVKSTFSLKQQGVRKGRQERGDKAEKSAQSDPSPMLRTGL